MVFYHNINPVFLDLSGLGLPLQIRFYGLVYFIGFLAFYFLLRYNVKKGRVKHMSLSMVDDFTIYFMVGSIIGARVLDFVFYNPRIFLVDPLEVFRVWNGGMSIHGGIIGAMVAGYLFTRKNKIQFYVLADIIAIPLMFMLGIGRIANFINGEIPGTLYNGSLCVDYSQSSYVYNVDGCRHPYVLYESVKNFFVAFLLFFEKKYFELKPGILFWSSMFFYNFLRFFVDFFRYESRVLGLSVGQYICLAFIFVSVYFLYVLTRVKVVEKVKHNENKKIN